MQLRRLDPHPQNAANSQPMTLLSFLPLQTRLTAPLKMHPPTRRQIQTPSTRKPRPESPRRVNPAAPRSADATADSPNVLSARSWAHPALTTIPDSSVVHPKGFVPVPRSRLEQNSYARSRPPSAILSTISERKMRVPKSFVCPGRGTCLSAEHRSGRQRILMHRLPLSVLGRSQIVPARGSRSSTSRRATARDVSTIPAILTVVRMIRPQRRKKM